MATAKRKEDGTVVLELSEREATVTQAALRTCGDMGEDFLCSESRALGNLLRSVILDEGGSVQWVNTPEAP